MSIKSKIVSIFLESADDWLARITPSSFNYQGSALDKLTDYTRDYIDMHYHSHGNSLLKNYVNGYDDPTNGGGDTHTKLAHLHGFMKTFVNEEDHYGTGHGLHDEVESTLRRAKLSKSDTYGRHLDTMEATGSRDSAEILPKVTRFKTK